MFNGTQRTPPKGRRLEEDLAQAAKRGRSDLDRSGFAPQMREEDDGLKRPRVDLSEPSLGASNMVATPATVPRHARESSGNLDANGSIQDDPEERMDTPLVNCYQVCCAREQAYAR
eukprot:1563224-Pyramimonas_sp.AAC.1